jgi:hypothetical protein
VILQQLFAVVTHNVPAMSWDGDEDTLQNAIWTIEEENLGSVAFEFLIQNLNWLNSADTRQGTNCRSLMISFKTRKTPPLTMDSLLTAKCVIH